MKPENTFYLSLPLTAGLLMTLCMTACQSDRLEVPDRQEYYNREFIRQFGTAGLSHEWNAAIRVNADIESSLLAGASTVNIYTCWPGNPDCVIAASYEASSVSSIIEFDYPQGLKKAYVQILDDKGKALYAQYVSIENGCMTVGSRGSRSESMTAGVYAYDLGTNRGLGTLRVDRDYNRDFWNNFTTNNGTSLGITDVNIRYKEYSPLTVKEGADGEGNAEISMENGYTFGPEWNVNAHIDRGLPADMASNTAIFELTYSTPADTDAPALMKWSDYNWQGYRFTGENGLTLEPTGGQRKTVEIKAEGINNLKDNLVRIQGVNYTLYSLRFKGATNNIAYINNIFSLYGLATNPVNNFEGYRLSYIRPSNASEQEAYSARDLVPLVGHDGVFHEEINKSSGQCNLEAYREQLKIDDRMDFIVAEDRSEVSIDYLFGSTSYFNSFGYFYYTDAEANLPEEQRMAVLLKKPKFILMYDACPYSNLLSTNPAGYGDGVPRTDFHQLTSGLTTDTSLEIIGANNSDGHEEGKNVTWNWDQCKRFADYVSEAENPETPGSDIVQFRSAKYRLVYYSPEQFDSHNKLREGAEGSYKFPLGTHIAFFVITSGQYILEKGLETDMSVNYRRIQFSVPLMNKYMGNTINYGHRHQDSGNFDSNMITGNGTPAPWTPFVAYQWNGEIIMGVEDGYAETENGLNGSDHDMNDMLLRVNGRFVDDLEELQPEKPAVQSWLIACEDLGGTHDFDFNDVVIGISHVAGETTAQVTALAAGGTLPVYIQSKYPPTGNSSAADSDGYYTLAPAGSDGELHRWWNADNSHFTPINAYAWGGAGNSVTIEVPEDFTLSDTASRPGEEGNMGGFRVIVHQPDGKTSTITAPDPTKDAQAPQMFLAPRSWLWPRETQSIDGVYGGFIPWYEKWWETRDGAKASNVVLHTWRPVHD